MANMEGGHDHDDSPEVTISEGVKDASEKAGEALSGAMQASSAESAGSESFEDCCAGGSGSKSTEGLPEAEGAKIETAEEKTETAEGKNGLTPETAPVKDSAESYEDCGAAAAQDKAIAEVESGEKSLDTNAQKGNYGEMKVDADMREAGYDRISTDTVTSLEDKGHQGIDGVYENKEGVIAIVDAKYNTAQLIETADGKQMNETWVDNRLTDSVGKMKADEIRERMKEEPDKVNFFVAHVDETGKVTYDRLDRKANVIEKNADVNELPDVNKEENKKDSYKNYH